MSFGADSFLSVCMVSKKCVISLCSCVNVEKIAVVVASCSLSQRRQEIQPAGRQILYAMTMMKLHFEVFWLSLCRVFIPASLSPALLSYLKARNEANIPLLTLPFPPAGQHRKTFLLMGGFFS